jgi:glycosyltransferase involved in cell wall biosynthesis
MSDMVDITMVVPKTSPGFKMQNMNLVGINQVRPHELGNMPSNYRQPLPFKLEAVEADLNPYYSESASAEYAKNSLFTQQHSESLGGVFDIDSLYGGNVINKVMQYADITASLASKMDFDVIHAHDWMTMIAGVKIKQQSGKPLVMHLHSLEVDRSGPESKGWVYQLEKHGMEYADLLMPVSNFTASNIEQYYGVGREKMQVVHNGSRPVEAFRSKRRFREKTVLFVGRLTRQKGPEKFLEIAARVLQRNPDVRFVMAGVGDYFKSVLEQSAYRHLGNRFHLTCFLDVNNLNYIF